MLSLQFIAQNLHFAISLFAGMVFFAVFWLYFDAWLGLGHRRNRTIFNWAGFLIVAVSFIIYATVIEQASLGRSLFGDIAALVANVLRFIGYGLIIVGQLVDPLQPKPVTRGLEDLETAEAKEAAAPPAQSAPPAARPAPVPAVQVPVSQPGAQVQPAPQSTEATNAGPKASYIGLAAGNGFGTAIALPLEAAAIAILYWRRATTGLERHLKPVAAAFAFLFGFELFAVSALFRSTDNPNLFNLVQAFGPLWIVSHVLLLAGTLVLGRWVWRYLTERFISQIFMTFTGVVLAVFLLTTVSFTFLLLRNIQDDGLNNLATATNVLGYALDSRKAATQANAEAIAANPAIAQAITSKDHKALVTLTSTFLESKHQASLVLTTDDGQVLLRAEDPDRWGDSISSDTLVRRALIGTVSSTVDSRSGVLAPILSIRSVVPVRNSAGTIVGTAGVATTIDNAFVDGIKHSTGLDSAVYSGNVRSATTFTAPDGVSRWVGVKETNSDVQDTVLKHSQTFKGQLDILNRQYLAVYAPLKDADNVTVGMLFVGEPEIVILQTTAYLIRITFIVSVVLLVLSIIPAYLIARHITKQLE